MKALILAGGEGKRLRPLTSHRPKSLLEVGSRPIIAWQIEWMKKYGVDSFVIAAGYMHNELVEYLGDGSRFGVEIEFSIEEEPLDTGGAIKNAYRYFNNEDVFVVSNGDTVTNLKLDELISSCKNVSTMALTTLRSYFGVVEIDDTKVVSYMNNPFIKGYWLNTGIYAMSKEIFDYLPDKGSLERLTFPALIKEGLLGYVKFEDIYWRSVDSLKDFEEINSDLKTFVL